MWQLLSIKRVWLLILNLVIACLSVGFLITDIFPCCGEIALYQSIVSKFISTLARDTLGVI